MHPDRAQLLAVQALAWFAADDDILPTFLQATGASGAELSAVVGDPALQGAILDFLLTNDAWIMAFCDAHRLAYTDPAAARAALPGGAAYHWT